MSHLGIVVHYDCLVIIIKESSYEILHTDSLVGRVVSGADFRRYLGR